jgi:colicin import membrane protein
MSPAHASALARRDRMWPAVTTSAVLHALAIVWAVSRPAAPAIDLQQKPIVAKLVRLGEKRPEDFLPRKPAAQPAPAPPAPVAAPAAPKAPAPAPAAKPPPPAPTPAAKPPPPGSTLASVLSKVKKQAQDERYGAPDGDAGGDSDTAEGERYLALVHRAIHANYRVPSTIPERERLYLQASIVVWIDPDGHVTRWSVEHPSGNPTFDAAVERTLKATGRVPPPPDHLRDTARRTGVALLFQPR